MTLTEKSALSKQAEAAVEKHKAAIVRYLNQAVPPHSFHLVDAIIYRLGVAISSSWHDGYQTCGRFILDTIRKEMDR